MFVFSSNWILLLPEKIRNGIWICAHEISNFWQSAKQMIEIVKLPIEIVLIIFKTIKGIVLFLHSLEKPKMFKKNLK